jgi:hypothetical protein
MLSAEDFQRLGRHEAYASILVDGHVTPYCSLRLPPPAAPISDPDAIRALSRQRYGADRHVVEAELHHAIAADTASVSLGGRRRSS